MLWPKFVLIIKVDEQVGGEVNFRSFCWRKWCVKDARVDGSISPQLGAPVQDVHVHLLRGTQQGNECIHFIYWNNRRVIEGILKGPTTTKKRQKKMQLPIKKTICEISLDFFWFTRFCFFCFFLRKKMERGKRLIKAAPFDSLYHFSRSLCSGGFLNWCFLNVRENLLNV